MFKYFTFLSAFLKHCPFKGIHSDLQCKFAYLSFVNFVSLLIATVLRLYTGSGVIKYNISKSICVLNNFVLLKVYLLFLFISI
jgi:hypothetical protein